MSSKENVLAKKDKKILTLDETSFKIKIRDGRNGKLRGRLNEK